MHFTAKPLRSKYGLKAFSAACVVLRMKRGQWRGFCWRQAKRAFGSEKAQLESPGEMRWAWEAAGALK